MWFGENVTDKISRSNGAQSVDIAALYSELHSTVQNI